MRPPTKTVILVAVLADIALSTVLGIIDIRRTLRNEDVIPINRPRKKR